VRIGTGLDGDGATVEIVGVVADTPQESLAAPVRPTMYRPLAQPSRAGLETISLVVRSEGEPVHLTGAVRQAIRDVHPQAAVAAIRGMREVAAAGIARERTAALALGAFGGLVLLLAAVGLYGVMARQVGERAREIGVRIALGAGPGEVQRLVLGRTARMLGAGMIAGSLGGFAVARSLETLLHGTSGVDPFVILAACTLLVLVGLAASVLPVRRASRTDPLLVMRAE
jgi:predicted lysophospholipase L1 biosynthesis ABC-type transport system permease subunit